MPNPLVAQGTLNLLRASVVWPSTPNLNVTPPYLMKAGIRFVLQGKSVEYINAMTGAVTSPQPYMMVEMTININKANGLADIYKSQMELNALIGDGTVRPDTTGLSPFQIVNCSIEGVRELDFSGADGGYAAVIGGYYLINASLFDI